MSAARSAAVQALGTASGSTPANAWWTVAPLVVVVNPSSRTQSSKATPEVPAASTNAPQSPAWAVQLYAMSQQPVAPSGPLQRRYDFTQSAVPWARPMASTSAVTFVIAAASFW